MHSAHSGWSRSVRLESKLKRRNEDRRWCERGEGFGCGGSSGAGAGGTAAVALRDLENDGFLGWDGVVVGRFEGMVRITLSCRSTNDSLGCTGPRCGCFRCVVGDDAVEEVDPCTEFLHAAFAEDGDGS